MTKQQFNLEVKGYTVKGAANVAKDGLLITDSIEFDESSTELLTHGFPENDPFYFDLLDTLCEQLDALDIFNEEVLTKHLP